MYFHNLIDNIYLWGEKFKQYEISNGNVISAYYNSNHQKYIIIHNYLIQYHTIEHVIDIEYNTEQELEQIINYELQTRIEEVMLNKL